MTSLVAFLVRLLSGLQARWLGTDPVDCQRVYFANHTSTLDAAVLWAALPSSIRERTRPVAAKDYWTASVLRRWLANDVFRALLIERLKVTSENNPLREMVAVLDAGDSLIIFPEGGRFRPGGAGERRAAIHLGKAIR
jgi:1-acyl-sn-glycerol-3-phosphate acyltransferase